MQPIKKLGGLDADFFGPKYQSLGLLGSGSYGDVYKVKDKQTGKLYAIKKYKKIFSNRILALRTLRQVTILRRINHKFIIKIYDILPPKDVDNYDTLGVVLQYLPFDLKRLCEKNKFLMDQHIPKVVYQILVALKYLRSVNILHRDLKPQNILADDDFNIKICDFGLARPGLNQMTFEQMTISSQNQYTPEQVKNGQNNTLGLSPINNTKSKNFITCHVVSRWYRAPQLILMQTKYDSSIEMWAVGCILGELISQHTKNKKVLANSRRRALFQGRACFPLSPPKQSQAKMYKLNNGFPQSDQDQITKILKVIGSPTKQQVSFIEDGVASNYIKSLPLYQKKKPSQIFEYIKPEWEDFLNKTLMFDPRKRLTVDEALKHPLFDGIRQQQDIIFGNEDFDLFLPSDLSMQTIKQRLKEQIILYQKQLIMQEQK